MYIPALLLFSAFLYHLIICNKYASAKDSKFLLLLERRMPENQLSWLPDTQAREEGCFCPKKGDGCQPGGSENCGNDGKTFEVGATKRVKSHAIDLVEGNQQPNPRRNQVSFTKARSKHPRNSSSTLAAQSISKKSKQVILVQPLSGQFQPYEHLRRNEHLRLPANSLRNINRKFLRKELCDGDSR